MNGSDGPEPPGSFSADDWEPAGQTNRVEGAGCTGQRTRFVRRRRAGACRHQAPRALRFSAHSAAELVLGIPWALWSLTVVSTVSTWIFDGFVDALMVALWVLSGVLIVLPVTEDYVAMYLCRLRKPTLLEQQKLAIAWRAVCARAGVDPGYHKLWVEEADSVNGSQLPAALLQ